MTDKQSTIKDKSIIENDAPAAQPEEAVLVQPTAESTVETVAEASLDVPAEAPAETSQNKSGAGQAVGVRKAKALPSYPVAFLKKFLKRLRLWFRGLTVIWRIVVGLLVIIVIGGVVYIYSRPQDETAAITNKVQKLVALPSGEKPVLTTVVDKSKATQPFLANAQNGDKVLLFSNARKAIVYRPSTNRIINIGPILTTLVPVFIRSGAPTADVDAVIRQIQGQAVNFTVVSRDNSPKNDYRQTLVIDLTGARSSAAQQLAELLHATVSGLPAGESRPDADLLVIVSSSTQ